MRRRLQNAEPGTGTQYYTEACSNPEHEPRLAEEIERADDPERARLIATQYRFDGRTWQCGGQYWDDELQELVTLEAVVRKSAWCDTGPAEEGTLRLRFVSQQHGSYEIDPNMLDEQPRTERFRPKHNVPFKLK